MANKGMYFYRYIKNSPAVIVGLFLLLLRISIRKRINYNIYSFYQYV